VAKKKRKSGKRSGPDVSPLGRRLPVTVRVSARILDAVDDAAEEENTNRSRWVEMALARELAYPRHRRR